MDALAEHRPQERRGTYGSSPGPSPHAHPCSGARVCAVAVVEGRTHPGKPARMRRQEQPPMASAHASCPVTMKPAKKRWLDCGAKHEEGGTVALRGVRRACPCRKEGICACTPGTQRYMHRPLLFLTHSSLGPFRTTSMPYLCDAGAHDATVVVEVPLRRRFEGRRRLNVQASNGASNKAAGACTAKQWDATVCQGGGASSPQNDDAPAHS